MRLSYAKNSAGDLEILDRNDYYAFGMNMYTQTSVYDATGTPLNNKYNNKELQETGFYDYGWRQYMPDLGRWFGMDKLSETYSSTSPYAYVMNNPISHLDPDGRYADNWLQDMWDNTKSSSTWSNNGDGSFSGGEVKGKGGDPGKGLFGSIGAFFGNIFGNIFGSSARQNAQITTVLPGAQVSRAPILNVGELTWTLEGEAAAEAGMTTAEAEAIVARSLSNILKVGVWTLPLILNGDAARTHDKDIPSITLYRGVSANANSAMYNEALMGIAIPNGLRTVSTIYSPHRSPDLHAEGDNYSIWTSWTTDPAVARYFSGGTGGVILSKQFSLGQVSPNLSITAQGNSIPSGRPENEWLVPGFVFGAGVSIVK